MLIELHFQFADEVEPASTTGVEGEVTDLILPSVGDVVRHRDADGRPFSGMVLDRTFEYDISQGIHVNGAVLVTLTLGRTVVN